MENAEELLHVLEEFSERKPKTIPQELNEYLTYVARTGDPVYQWPVVKCLFKEKLMNVITDFHETTPGVDIPPYPNVDPFNYDVMKNSLLERLDAFTSAPFTVQRLCELLTTPRKQYNRVDKFMRAIEKNILVVSTTEPGCQRHIEQENGESMEPIVNGSDNNSDYNVDVEMEDMSWKEGGEQQQRLEPQPSSSDNNSDYNVDVEMEDMSWKEGGEQQQRLEPQPSSSVAHINVDDVEARLQAKQQASDEIQSKSPKQYESVTPPEQTVNTDEQMESKSNELTKVAKTDPQDSKLAEEVLSKEVKTDSDVKATSSAQTSSKPQLIIPVIKVDDAEMTEQKLNQQSISEKEDILSSEEHQETPPLIAKTEGSESSAVVKNVTETTSDSFQQESSSAKAISELSTSSEESSSSDNTDGNSNSPKTDTEVHIDTLERNSESPTKPDPIEESKSELDVVKEEQEEVKEKVSVKSENYSISDVKSEIQVASDTPVLKLEPTVIEENKSVEPAEVIVEKKESQLEKDIIAECTENVETKSE